MSCIKISTLFNLALTTELQIQRALWHKTLSGNCFPINVVWDTFKHGAHKNQRILSISLILIYWIKTHQLPPAFQALCYMYAVFPLNFTQLYEKLCLQFYRCENFSLCLTSGFFSNSILQWNKAGLLADFRTGRRNEPDKSIRAS